MGTGSKKHKGGRAKEREMRKGGKQGPKRVGTTKPPPGVKASISGGKFATKKAKKAAATAAAWALIEGSSSSKQKKHHFSY